MRRVECGTTVRDDTWVLITFFAPWWWWPTNDEGWIDRQWSDDDNKLSHSWRVSSWVFVFMFILDWFLLCTLYPFIWLNLNNWAIAQIDTWLLPFWHSLSLRFISSNYRERWSGRVCCHGSWIDSLLHLGSWTGKFIHTWRWWWTLRCCCFNVEGLQIILLLSALFDWHVH